MGAICAALLCLSIGASAASSFCLASCIAGGISRRSLSRGADAVRLLARRMRRRLDALPRISELVRRRKLRRRGEEMRRQMPEAVRLLCIALDSGSSLTQALDYAANNTAGALGHELRHVVWDLEAGQGFDEAMENLRSRTGGSEFAYLAVAMEIQHVCGGSLGAVLDAVSASLHASAELEEQFASKTAQAKLSARVVALMPIGLLAVISLLSPGYIAMFFSSPLGVVMLVAGLVLEVSGIVLVRRCTDVGSCTMAGGVA